MISHENRVFGTGMQGLPPPYSRCEVMPPLKRAPRGGLNYRISWRPYLPSRAPREALKRGDLIKMSLIFNNFHGSGVNSSFMCVSMEQNFYKPIDGLPGILFPINKE